MKRLLLAVSGLVCLGQSFEVASIHLHEGVLKMSGLNRDGPLITFSAMTLADLVIHAFEIRDFQLDRGTGVDKVGPLRH